MNNKIGEEKQDEIQDGIFMIGEEDEDEGNQVPLTLRKKIFKTVGNDLSANVF